MAAVFFEIIQYEHCRKLAYHGSCSASSAYEESAEMDAMRALGHCGYPLALPVFSGKFTQSDTECRDAQHDCSAVCTGADHRQRCAFY